MEPSGLTANHSPKRSAARSKRNNKSQLCASLLLHPRKAEDVLDKDEGNCRRVETSDLYVDHAAGLNHGWRRTTRPNLDGQTFAAPGFEQGAAGAAGKRPPGQCVHHGYR